MKNLSLSGNMPTLRLSKVLVILLALFIFSATKPVSGQAAKMVKDPDVIGRWDLTVDKGGKSLPSWLEVQKSGTHTLIGRFVYAFGSARPISEVPPPRHRRTNRS